MKKILTLFSFLALLTALCACESRQQQQETEIQQQEKVPVSHDPQFKPEPNGSIGNPGR